MIMTVMAGVRWLLNCWVGMYFIYDYRSEITSGHVELNLMMKRLLIRCHGWEETSVDYCWTAAGCEEFFLTEPIKRS